MARFSTESTPNPNSLKITSANGAFIPTGLESFSSAAEAARHPLGKRLFEVEGIANVFIVPQFLTISKLPSADWRDIWPRIQAVLESYFDAG